VSEGWQSRLSLLRSADFRRLWLTSAVAEAVRAIEILMTSIFVYRLTGEAFDVVLINFVRAAPLIFVGPTVGVLASRFDRRWLLLGQLIVLFATSIVLAVLATTGTIAVWHIAVGGFLGGTFFAADFALRRTMLADVAGQTRVATAIGLDLATRSLTRMLGPISGGILFDTIGLDGGYVVGVALYGLCLWWVWNLEGSFAAIARTTAGFFSDLREGIRFIRGHQVVSAILIVTVIMNLTVFSHQTLVPVVGESILGLSATAIGLLASAEGLGAAIGSVLVAMTAPPAWYRRLFLFGAILATGAVTGFALSDSPVLSFVFLFLAGLGIACYATMQSTLSLTAPPPEMKTRVMGTLSVCIGFSPLGILYLGQFAAHLSPDVAILASAAQGLVALGLVLLFFPALRRAER